MIRQVRPSGRRDGSTLNPEVLTPGHEPRLPVLPGTATLIATGGMVPRGADAIVMVEHSEAIEGAGDAAIDIRRAASAGQFISFAGSDMARGETVLRAGQVLSSREIGMLAAVGRAAVEVWRQPRVAVISTGDEIIAPGEPLRPGAVYDSNAAIIAAAVEEAGGVPQPLGIGPDDETVLCRLIDDGLGGLRHGRAVRRHIEGCGRSLLPRRRALWRPRNRRARRRAKAGQALVSGGDRRQADHRPAGLPDLGDLHLSRVRCAANPRVSADCRSSRRNGCRRRCRCGFRQSAGEPNT